MNTTILDAARAYVASGLKVVPVPHRAKVPVLKEWEKLDLAEADLPRHFNGRGNVGVLLSASGLVDADLDVLEAAALAPIFLPPTRLFGRASKPRSHAVYRVAERRQTKRYQIRENGKLRTIAEYRDRSSKGTPVQTVFPPSTHESGEAIAWEGPAGEPFAEIDADDLFRRVRHLSGCAVLLMHYPRGEGGRHDAAGALASVFARSGVAEHTVELVRAFADYTGDDDPDDRARFAEDTVQRIREGGVTTGAPTLLEMLASTSEAEKAVRTALEWIEFDGRAAPQSPSGKTRPPADRSILDIRTGAEWMKYAAGIATPRPLWGPLWFEGETTILFSETNAGKSVLGVQLAEAIASGRPFPGFPAETDPQAVLYLDFELSAKQVERRYSRDFEDPYAFSPNFHRAEIDPDALADEGEFDRAVRDAIESAIVTHGYRVVIVDNLTFIARQSQEAKDALPLMRALQRIKLSHGLSMLVLGHTPKRDPSRPLTLNDLAGSRHLANFADAVVGLGRSAREPDVRYLKQLKVRSAEMEYHAENVAALRLEKPGNFLGFTLLDHGPESAHLKEHTESDRAQRDTAILDLHAAGKSLREIADQMFVSHMTVKRVLDKAEAAPSVTSGTPRPSVTPVTGQGGGATGTPPAARRGRVSCADAADWPAVSDGRRRPTEGSAPYPDDPCPF